MPRDHFVAKTYLKHFQNPGDRDRLQAYRKSDGAQFPCYPDNVCWEWDGDVNREFLSHPNLLGDFRQISEPHWDVAVASILRQRTRATDKFIVSAMLAALMTCTPAWQRLGRSAYAESMAATLKFEKRMREKFGGGDPMLIEAVTMLEEGKIRLETEPDYVKAVATRQLMSHALVFYNQDWTVLLNSSGDNFLTSDSPVAIEAATPVKPFTRYLPLSPFACLKVTPKGPIEPIGKTAWEEALKKAPKGKIDYISVSGIEARAVNRLMVQCAEELVFSTLQSAGVGRLVAKYSRHRVDMDFVTSPANEPNAEYQGVIVRVGEPKS